MWLMENRKNEPLLVGDNETFGNRLCRLRKAQDLTQPELGDLIGVSARALCSYERDQRLPTPQVLQKLAPALEVSLDELMGLSGVLETQKSAVSKKWLRKFEQIERLTDRKQRAIMQVLDMALHSA